MAYADAANTQHKMGTAAVVVALEAGLVWAVITGLAVSFKPRHEPTLTSTFAEEPDITPPPEVPPAPPVRDDRRVITPPLPDKPPIDLGSGPITGGLITAGREGLGGGEGLGDAVFPDPTPDPPAFTPIKARPKGKLSQWVTPDDYPSMDQRLRHEGTSSFRLAIDAAGKPTGCTIVASSGWPGLDEATCTKIMRRARFEAAIDNTGARTEGTYSGAVNWQIPKD